MRRGAEPLRNADAVPGRGGVFLCSAGTARERGGGIGMNRMDKDGERMVKDGSGGTGMGSGREALAKSAKGAEEVFLGRVFGKSFLGRMFRKIVSKSC